MGNLIYCAPGAEEMEGAYLLASLVRLTAQGCLATLGWWVCWCSDQSDFLGVVIVTTLYPMAMIGVQSSVDWHPVVRGPLGSVAETLNLLALLVGLSPLVYSLWQLVRLAWQAYEYARVNMASDPWRYAWDTLANVDVMMQAVIAVAIVACGIVQVQRCVQAMPELPAQELEEPLRVHHFCLLHLVVAVMIWMFCFALTLDEDTGWTRRETRVGIWVLVAFALWIVTYTGRNLKLRWAHRSPAAAPRKVLA